MQSNGADSGQPIAEAQIPRTELHRNDLQDKNLTFLAVLEGGASPPALKLPHPVEPSCKFGSQQQASYSPWSGRPILATLLSVRAGCTRMQSSSCFRRADSRSLGQCWVQRHRPTPNADGMRRENGRRSEPPLRIRGPWSSLRMRPCCLYEKCNWTCVRGTYRCSPRKEFLARLSVGSRRMGSSPAVPYRQKIVVPYIPVRPGCDVPVGHDKRVAVLCGDIAAQTRPGRE